MGKKIDLTGQVFGRLIVVHENGRTKDGKVLWLCKCSCGNEVTVRGKDLRSGNTQSCGCYNRERIREVLSICNRKHGLKADYPRVYQSITNHFRDINNGLYPNCVIDERYENSIKGVVKFCEDLVRMFPAECERYEADKSLDLDKDNADDRVFRPESIVFRHFSQNRSKHIFNVRIDGVELIGFRRQLGISSKEFHSKYYKYFWRHHKPHPELLAKANEYLTLLRRLRASLDLLKDVREFRERCKGLQMISLQET